MELSSCSGCRCRLRQYLFFYRILRTKTATMIKREKAVSTRCRAGRQNLRPVFVPVYGIALRYFSCRSAAARQERGVWAVSLYVGYVSASSIVALVSVSSAVALAAASSAVAIAAASFFCSLAFSADMIMFITRSRIRFLLKITNKMNIT